MICASLAVHLGCLSGFHNASRVFPSSLSLALTLAWRYDALIPRYLVWGARFDASDTKWHTKLNMLVWSACFNINTLAGSKFYPPNASNLRTNKDFIRTRILGLFGTCVELSDTAHNIGLFILKVKMNQWINGLKSIWFLLFLHCVTSGNCYCHHKKSKNQWV